MANQSHPASAQSLATPYKPTPYVAEILDWCLARVYTVPYRVTARWLFYRLVQERGFRKDQYKKFLRWISCARKRFYLGWIPDILADDTRQAYLRGYGYQTPLVWMKSFKRQLCTLDKYTDQDTIVEIWFEAEAMFSQFNHYTKPYHVTLRPFRGDASIAYKWQIAKDLERLAQYKKPIQILYFGDLDKKGLEIPNNALRDIRAWCKADFSFLRCGINEEHVKAFKLPEQPEKPGCFQWEALSEEQAQELILGNLERFWSLDSIRAVEALEAKATQQWIRLVEEILERFKEEENSIE